MRALFLAVAIAACAAAPAFAQSVAAQAGAEGLARRCAASGGRPVAQPGLTRAIDLGGQIASALDPQRLTCAGAAPVDCGPFGCKLSIYFAGTTPVFETYVKAWRARGGRLDILRVGAYCASEGESCSETYRREGEELTLAGKGGAVFARDAAPAPAVRLKPPREMRRTPRTAARGVAGARPTSEGGRAARGPSGPPLEAAAPPAPAQAAAPVAPAISAERRRRLDAAPYVP